MNACNSQSSSTKCVRFSSLDDQHTCENEVKDDGSNGSLVPETVSSDSSTNNHDINRTRLEEPLTLLIEIAGVTLPPDKTSRMMDLGGDSSPKAMNARGMHCTACWVDVRRNLKPTASANHEMESAASGGRNGMIRNETILHRTKTLHIDGNKVMDAYVTDIPASSTGEIGTSEKNAEATSLEEEAKNTEAIFTVDDCSLFLFKTSMKQLLDASPSLPQSKAQLNTGSNQRLSSSKSKHHSESTSDERIINTINSSGGIRFDIFEKPIDALSSIYRSVLAESTKEKEDNATDVDSFTFSSKKVSLANYDASYRLVGSVFLTPEDILGRCDEERFECDLIDGLRRQQRCHDLKGKKQLERRSAILRGGNGGKLALRIRKASEFDAIFIQTLRTCDVNNVPISIEMLNDAVCRNDPTRLRLKPASILTESDEKEVAAASSLKALGNLSPLAYESVRYLFSDDKERRIFVKPYPDPNRVEETTWFTEEELHRECWKASSNWIKAGSGTLGKVYIEVLQCRGLPNVDNGPGNKTDAFVSIVYEDVMVQTDVIDDSLSPMWMPWTQRAFVFNMDHPSKAIYVGVVDYDVGPLEHECIGRAVIQVNKFSPGMVYTLSYKLYESSTLTDRGGDAGIITLRLRVEYDEKKYLYDGWSAPSPQFVNSQQWKSHRVAKYCCDGPHDDEVFEMRVFRSHINEIMTAKRTLTYVVSDAMTSIIFWRGQVKVGNAWLPLHSAIVFYFSVCVVERPQLLPSFFFFACGWVMMASMFRREMHPNPWRRGHPFSYYWNILIYGESLYVPKPIQPLEGYKETLKYEKIRQDRLDEDEARWAKQAELDAKVKNISDDSIIRTKAKANAPLTDPISSLAASYLLPYQQRLGRYCKKIRYARNVLNWSESVISFWFTLVFFACGAAALIVPWAFLLKWTSRLVVWTFLGPWMKAVDLFLHGFTLEEEIKRSKAKSTNELHNAFKLQCQAAKILRENTLKLKAFRVKLFGRYITSLPEYELSRHEDVPLPESSAQPYQGEDEVEAKLFVPGQNLRGVMVPSTGEYNVRSQVSAAIEKHCLFNKFNGLIRASSAPAQMMDENVNEGFEIVNGKNQIVCVRSCDLAENDQRKRLTRRLSSACESEIQERAIQAALENQMHEVQDVKRKNKSRWVFSASIHLSLTKEPANDDNVIALSEDSRSEQNIEFDSPDAIEEEGVEVVPYLLCEESKTGNDDELASPEDHASTDHISVLYVKDTENSMQDID